MPAREAQDRLCWRATQVAYGAQRAGRVPREAVGPRSPVYGGEEGPDWSPVRSAQVAARLEAGRELVA